MGAFGIAGDRAAAYYADVVQVAATGYCRKHLSAWGIELDENRRQERLLGDDLKNRRTGVRLAVTLAAALLGTVAGTALGFVVPLVYCETADWLAGNGGDQGMVTVGWVYCFLTIPLGMLIGAVLCGAIAWRRTKRWDLP